MIVIDLTSYPAFLIENVTDLGTIKAPAELGVGPSKFPHLFIHLITFVVDITVVHDKINSGALAGIIVGVIVAVVIVSAFTMFKVRQNRTAAVIALKQVNNQTRVGF